MNAEKSDAFFHNCHWAALTEKTANEISLWEYGEPFTEYNFKGHPNGYLFDENIWGTEQFCLMDGGQIIGQVSCQFDHGDLWVGWALNPQYCGKGNGHLFIQKCVEEIRSVKRHTGPLYLRVAASNKRAIAAYQKAGFRHVQTIEDEIAYTNRSEQFWVMEAEVTRG